MIDLLLLLWFFCFMLLTSQSFTVPNRQQTTLQENFPRVVWDSPHSGQNGFVISHNFNIPFLLFVLGKYFKLWVSEWDFLGGVVIKSSMALGGIILLFRVLQTLFISYLFHQVMAVNVLSCIYFFFQSGVFLKKK